MLSIDWRMACSGYEPGYSSGVKAMCGWYYQRLSVETGLPAAGVQDVQDSIAWVRAHAGTYWPWNGKIAAVGGSAGGNALLQAVATTSDPLKKPDVVASWSGKIEMGEFINRPNDGWTSRDTCDHSKPGTLVSCWYSEDFYLNSLDYSLTPPSVPTPVCAFPRPINQNQTKPCANTTDWLNASPYTQWNAGTHATLPPIFFSNGGGDPLTHTPNPDIYANAETVPLKEALEFQQLLGIKGFVQGTDMDLCVVDTKVHGTKYLFDPTLNCEDHAVGEQVFTSTVNFLNKFTRP